MPAPLKTVNSLLYEKNISRAEKICRHFLSLHPHHPEAMRLLAEIACKLQAFDDAEFLLSSSLKLYPDFERARLDYSRVLHKRQKYLESLEQAKILFDLDSRNATYAFCLAASYQAVGEFDKAISLYQDIVKVNTKMHKAYTALGHALKTIGQALQAVAAYKKAYEIQPGYGDAYWSLANLKTYRFSDNEVELMKNQLSSELITQEDQVQLSFSLGKAYEDRKQYAQSFCFYEKGNALKHRESTFCAERFEREVDLQINLFEESFFADRRGDGCPEDAPIFVIGLPRSGSTLIEQILSSHSLVDGTMELSNVISMAHGMARRERSGDELGYPSLLRDIGAKELRALGEKYILDTKIHRKSGKRFVDKMPNNFRHIPLIQLMLPNAKIIDARRHPLACCFSGFKQLFAEGQEFTYSLQDIARYYAGYSRLMKHWDRELPGRILRVNHEELVCQFDEQVCRILDFCNLKTEGSCFSFFETNRAIRTPSSEQVRQPIYRSGLESWKPYEPYIKDIIPLLKPYTEEYKSVQYEAEAR